MSSPTTFSATSLFDDRPAQAHGQATQDSMLLGNSPTVLDLPDVVSGSNPIVMAANPVLNLVPQIRSTAQMGDPARFREFLIEKVQEFERRARELGVPPETIIGARYCLCTLLDESAAQTPWGGSGVWSRHSLLVTFHNETWGGEKFFQLLSKLAQNPQQYRDLLELMYYCISLGLEGRFRVVDNGRAQLETLRQRLWTILRDQGVGSDDTLSPHWKGASGGGPQGWRLLPAWVVACLAALIGLGCYLWFAFSLAGRSDAVYASISGLHLNRVVAAQPKAAPEQRFSKFLEPEIREGLVSVRDEADRSTIILRGDGLFASGSTSVLPAYMPVLTRVADALATRPGQVMISGYTDNQPIRTARYPSNFELSRERAEQVAAILKSRGVAPERLRSQGLGDAQPVADNRTPEGRSRNRRVEVVLFAVPTAPAAGASIAPASVITPIPPSTQTAPSASGGAR
ncbi:DotU family type VI secretion system protein [Diaphorobacter sp. HDW4A]|uniref:DotU family type VI secretion system protein n=1 Tax=Diaphorobacter sp. HDW4A TaxID=2714924 RepID=UPI00140E9839|nr:DotU family type VI secretion system protein [Diaphorobacter sp. HDW4A]QIL80303.1 DotU family type VI secretion system protein [Diaphorobacter sp. HDW4A]